MATVETPVLSQAESVFDLGDRLATLVEEVRKQTVQDTIPEPCLSRLTDLVEALRSRLVRKTVREPRSLFDLDERLIELMDSAEECAEQGGIPQDLVDEITEYLQAFETKVDRIAGYCRWQESIACSLVRPQAGRRETSEPSKRHAARVHAVSRLQETGRRKVGHWVPSEGHGLTRHRRSAADW